MGIEPTPSAWKAEVLPLNYTRIAARSMRAWQQQGNAAPNRPKLLPLRIRLAVRRSRWHTA